MIRRLIFSSLMMLACSIVPYAMDSISDILVGGTYNMFLKTDENSILTGIVESKTDTSLVLDCGSGQAYSFRINLIDHYDLVSPPKSLAAPIPTSATMVETELLSWESIRNSPALADKKVDVKISSGMHFIGTIVSVTDSLLTLSISGSSVPFTRSVVDQISLVPAQVTAAPSQPAVPKGPFDTVYIKNPQVDDYGKAGPDLLVIGTLSAETDNGVTIKTNDGLVRSLAQATIVRINKHTQASYEDPIAAYAKPLFCPSDMLLIDMPPGMTGRPFFKVCVDKYEFPNQENVPVKRAIAFDAAKAECARKGKRLCTTQEWQWACSGMEGYAYPYGQSIVKDNCNMATDPAMLENSGSRSNCISKFGVYDMTGNVFEWVTAPTGSPMLMGGPLSKCQTQSPGMDGSAKILTGIRCCKGNN